MLEIGVSINRIMCCINYTQLAYIAWNETLGKKYIASSPEFEGNLISKCYIDYVDHFLECNDFRKELHVHRLIT